MRNTIFYFVASTIVGAIVYALGFGMGASMLASLVIPPFLLLSWAIAKYQHWV